MSNSVAGKLMWRLQFLLGGEPPVARRLLGGNPFSLRERLAFVNPLAVRRTREDLVLHCLRRRGGADDHFHIGGDRIYFRPDFPLADEESLLAGVVLVLKEAYLHPDLCSDRVRVEPGDCVFDLGGNLGTSALIFARMAGLAGRVFSFEPLTPSLIERNMRENGVRNVFVVPLGVADRCGSAEMLIGEGIIDSSVARPPRGARVTRTIELTTLDRYVETRGLDRVDFIKMDIEGAEELALRGARRVIERFRPRWSIASYHTDFEGEPQHPKLVRLLKEAGYELEEVGSKRIFAW